MLDIYLQTGLLIGVICLALWIASLVLRDVSIVDRFWGLFFIVAGWSYFHHQPETTMRSCIVMVLLFIWGIRLSLYITIRNWGTDEDYRYAAMRAAAGGSFWIGSLFKVFLLQGFLAWVISSTLLAAMSGSTGLHLVDGLSLLVWMIGFIFEAGGDFQLSRFKSKPENKGKLLTKGLWKYSRHPNYFGDAACWWGYALFALAAGQWWGIGGTALMTYLLLHVSGVALLEKDLRVSKPGYEDYVANTPSFFPLSFKRKS
ncbi:MAG: DUF1295 domain-containing protein [Saprospiraceae bacterium]|nr:DUF1295 domain-containing protein [Saprospiraceae bacterium]